MVTFSGRADDLLLFTEDDLGVVVDAGCSVVVSSGRAKTLLSSKSWGTGEFSQIDEEIATLALQSLSPGVSSEAKRNYTIPRGVQLEAKKALSLHNKTKRGGTVVGLHTANLLASGGQIGIDQIVHISNGLNRHESDKFSYKWDPDDDGTPSASQITWSMWGGNAARKWATSIVDRSLVPPSEEIQTSADLDDRISPEFIARVRMDGTGIDRLYKIDFNSQVYVWDDGAWCDMGDHDNDIYSYDKKLDREKDLADKSHILIDPDSAIIVASCLTKRPFEPVTIEEIDSNEADLVAQAVEDGSEDWELVDRVITAAGPGDGIYSPDERSANAEKQVRDKNGRFAEVGTSVVVGGDVAAGSGRITKINPALGTVTVQLNSGALVDVPGNTVENAAKYSAPMPQEPLETTRVDTSGILGEPRVPINNPLAKIPGTLPALSKADLRGVLTDWPAWVRDQRSRFQNPPNPTRILVGERNSTDIGDEGRKAEEETGTKYITDAYTHPLISKWLNKQTDDGYFPNKINYRPVTSAAEPVPAKAEKPKAMTPATSDVSPIYLAIVDSDDPRAVLKLVGLVPATSKSAEAATYARQEGKWVKDDKVLTDLNSPTPPPVVPLDSETLSDVIEQVDATQGKGGLEASGAPISLDLALTVLWGPRSHLQAITAAGGYDRNRGGAEKLRRYWTYGTGGAKIRWGSGGDWTRCVRHLSKYMGPRARGYCALRHKEMTGLWTGDKRHRQLYSRKGATKMFSTDVINSEDRIRQVAALTAEWRAARAKLDGTLTAGATLQGARFKIPLVLPEGIDSGDNRSADIGSIDIRNLPLPLLWQEKTADGHDGSYIVGRIDFMERIEGGIGNAYGYFDLGEHGSEAERLVRNKFLRWVSADMDKFEATEEEPEEDPKAVAAELEGKKIPRKIKQGETKINKARIMAVTLVAKPAFQECLIFIDEEEYTHQEEVVIPDGIYREDGLDPIEEEALTACAFVAGTIPVSPPTHWFDNPKLEEPTPLTVTDEGQVYGHIAIWGTNHIGRFGTTAPKSKSNYAYFHTGVIKTDDGTEVPVGQLTVAGGHAGQEASARDAVRHYDDTASATADVHAGEDRFGIWVSGGLRPGTTPEQIRVMRASAPSGDWRPIRNNLELVAVCHVNVPGFPIGRAYVASGKIMSLVAAGAMPLALLKKDPLSEFSTRVEKLEQFQKKELSAKVAPARTKFQRIREERETTLMLKAESLSARVDAASEFGYVPRAERMNLAKEGKALPDGSYPIRNESDLKAAILAYGRAKNKTAARNHIMKRARQLRKTSLIPESWSTAALDAVTASASDLRARVLSASSEIERKRIEELRRKANEDVEAREDAKPDITPVPTPETEEVPGPEAPAPEDKPMEYKGGKFTPDTQPRDAQGKFRLVLARIRDNIGIDGNQKVLEKLQETENLDNVGDYVKASESAADLINTIERLDSGALNATSLSNVRLATSDLGKVIANLPLPFSNQAQKIRFSDLPPALRTLLDDLVNKVVDKIGAEDGAIATAEVKKFMSGADLYSQSEVSSQMNKLLRLLT